MKHSLSANIEVLVCGQQTTARYLKTLHRWREAHSTAGASALILYCEKQITQHLAAVGVGRLSVKGQIINVSGFCRPSVSVTTARPAVVV